MIYRFSLRNVKDMLLNQIGNNFFKSIDDEILITRHFPTILERFENTLSQCDNKYCYRINDEGKKEAYFDPLHSGQWLIFLYITANTIFECEKDKVESARVVCDKIYCQAKAFSGCDIYYEVKMPEVFWLEHPTGAVMGRATYGNNFYFTDGCVVGNDDDVYPVIGDNVKMMSGSKIIGNCHIGDNCVIGEGVVIKNKDLPAGTIV